MYRALAQDYTVYPGQQFWHALTGDEHFYFDLIKAFKEVALGENCSEIMDSAIKKLAGEIPI